MDTAAPMQQLGATLKKERLDIDIPSITPFRLVPSSKSIGSTTLYNEGFALSTLDKFVISARKFGPELRKQSSLATKLDSQIQGDRKQLKQLKRKLQEASKSSKTTSPTPAPEATKSAKATTAPLQPARCSPPSLDGEQLEKIREKFRYEYRYVTKPRHVFRPVAPRDGPSLSREVESKRRRVEKLTVLKRAAKQEIAAFGRSYETAVAPDDLPVLRLSAVPYQTGAEAYSGRRQKISIVKCRLQAEKEAEEWAQKALARGDSGPEV